MAVDIKTTTWLSIGILLLQIAIKLVKETGEE
jgi:hypothetical protein